jgi:hypothetical protein
LDVHKLVDFLRLLAEILAAVAAIVSAVTGIIRAVPGLWQWLRKLFGRPISAGVRLFNHPFIFLEAAIAEGAIGLSVGIVLGHVASSPGTPTALANTFAITGLVISLIAWTTAMSLSFRYRQWVWLIGLFLFGAVPYAAAIFASDFQSYLLVSAVPGMYGVLGPRSEKSWGGTL